MAFSCVGSRRVRSRALVAMIGIVAVAVAAVASPAEAARKKKRPAGGGYSPPYAAMVVDEPSILELLSVSLRFAPTVHGTGDHGFIATLCTIALDKGVSGFPGDGHNH